MCKLIKKMNRELRGAFFLIGIIALIFGLGEKEVKKSRNKHGFQNHEFDDIW